MPHMDVAQNLRARVTQVLVFGSIYQAVILVHFFVFRHSHIFGVNAMKSLEETPSPPLQTASRRLFELAVLDLPRLHRSLVLLDPQIT